MNPRADTLKIVCAGAALASFALETTAVAPPSVSNVPPAGVRPNIILILSDDQRWDTLGVSGNKAISTPSLDRMAREGFYFRQGTVLVSQCSPCRAMMLTGLAPHQNGWLSNHCHVPEVANQDGFHGMELVPGLLQKAGYRTVLVGKWHLRPRPWNCGFTDIRLWMSVGAGPYTDPKLARGSSGQAVTVKGFTTELFAGDAMEFLSSKAAKEKPFFLWLAVTAPHVPTKPIPDRIKKIYDGKSEEELAPPDFPKGLKTVNGTWVDYYGAITHLDEQVGLLRAALEKNGLAENTVVVFMGDNGYMMGTHDWGGKELPYESSVRVPYIIYAPKLPMFAGPRGINDVPVSSLDLPPTLVAMGGVSPPKEWPGRNLTPFLSGGGARGLTEAVSVWADDQSAKFGHLGFRMVRTPAHKLIVWQNPAKGDELYDLVVDPQESRNLVKDPAMQSVREDLMKRLKAWMERTVDPALKWKKWGK